MNILSPQHLIPILIIFFLLFGSGKISEFMQDLAKGIKGFQKGLRDGDNPEKQNKSSSYIMEKE